MMGRWVVTNEWSMILKVLLGNVRIVSSGRSIKKKKASEILSQQYIECIIRHLSFLLYISSRHM